MSFETISERGCTNRQKLVFLTKLPKNIQKFNTSEGALTTMTQGRDERWVASPCHIRIGYFLTFYMKYIYKFFLANQAPPKCFP